MMTELAIVFAKMRERRRNRLLTSAQFQEMQLGKFRRLVRHAQAHAPYYARIIDERRIDVERCRPADFPLLTKSILMANFDDVVTDRRITKQAVAAFLTRSQEPMELFLDEYRVMHTSGTSGEVGYFLYSNRDWARGMSPGSGRQGLARRRSRGFGRTRFAFYGATGGHFAGITMLSSARRGIARFFVDARAFEINSPLPDVLAQLNEFQPQVLSGYTTALKMLGEKQLEGLLRISPINIGASGEMVTAADMAFLRRAFGGADVASAYGCTEHLIVGASAPNDTNLTLFDDDLIFEFYDDHSVITNLFNETMPLIRYRMSDILRPLAQSSTTHTLVISGLVGRTELMPTFVNRDGDADFISPHIINEVFVAGVTRFQLHLTSRTSFRFLVMLEHTLDESHRKRALAALDARLREILEQKRMGNVTFEIAVVDAIPVDPRTRKFRLIIEARSDVAGNAECDNRMGQSIPDPEPH